MPATMPLGIIIESNEEGGIMMFTRPTDRFETTCETPVVIHNEDRRYNATAKMRGFVTEVSGAQASFRIVESEISPNWPAHLDPRGAGMGVYLGDGRGGYEPDMYQRPWANEEEMKMLHEFSKHHEDETGIAPTVGVITEILQIQQDPEGYGGPPE